MLDPALERAKLANKKKRNKRKEGNIWDDVVEERGKELEAFMHIESSNDPFPGSLPEEGETEYYKELDWLIRVSFKCISNC